MKTGAPQTGRSALAGTMAGRASADRSPVDSSGRGRRLPWKRAAKDASREPELMATWTGGSQLAAKGIAGVAVAAILAGPAALALTLFSGDPSVLAQASATSPDREARESAAREVAAEALRAYLTTPAEQARTLAAYWPGTTVLRPEQAPAVSDVEVVSATAPAPGVWQITLAATLTTAAAKSGEKQTSRRAFFDLPMSVAGKVGTASASPMSLPAEVPGPALAGGPDLAYTQHVAGSSPVGRSAQGFLAALLAGAGDITRWSAPGTSVAPIALPPYEVVEVSSARAHTNPAGLSEGVPDEGSEVELLVDVKASTAAGQQHGMQYLLQMRARSGRWEVARMQSAPQVTSPTAVASPSVTSSPTASSTPTSSTTP